ncbi:MAG: NIPSNAP family protein [Mycobacterium sp.]|nr:NIPSNAP family protein [Mycobacterium sp.]
MYYELATMTLPFGTACQAAHNVAAYASAPEAQGELLGCWFTDIGVLNQMIVLRGFATLADLQAERDRTQKSASPFGCGDIFQTLEQHSYQGFPWMKPVRPSAESGISGPVYEIRTYGIKTGGVQPTIDLWEQSRAPTRSPVALRGGHGRAGRPAALHQHLGLPHAGCAQQGPRRRGGPRHLAPQRRPSPPDHGHGFHHCAAHGRVALEVSAT